MKNHREHRLVHHRQTQRAHGKQYSTFITSFQLLPDIYRFVLNFHCFDRDSESESSAQSTPPAKKKPPNNRKPAKKQSRNSASTSKSDQSKDPGNSESDFDMKPVTRSSNTRKSKHLTGKYGSEWASYIV